ALVEQMASDVGCAVQDLLTDPVQRKKVNLDRYVNEDVGLPTLQDIMAELAKPGLDPRQEFENFAYTEGVNEIKDLKVGLKLKGIVTNITQFGAFVDIIGRA